MFKQITDKQSEKQPLRILNLQDSDEEHQDLQRQIQTFVKFELRRLKFTSLESQEKQKILDLVSKQMHEFVSQSYVIHDSQISTVLLGHRKRIKLSEKRLKGQLIILKVTKIITESFQQVLKSEGILFFKKQENNKCIILTMQEFKGINLDKIISHFSNDNFIRLDIVTDLTKQLIKEVKELHQKNIVHGDINVGNIVVRSGQMLLQRFINLQKHGKKQQKQPSMNNQTQKQSQVVELLYKDELQRVITGLFKYQNEESTSGMKQEQQKQVIDLQLIDFSHSWVGKQNQQQKQKQSNSRTCDNQISRQSPTQTINYRSPQGLYIRGSYQIDIWGIGHAIFTLLTGETIFNKQIQWTPQQLQQIFLNSQGFYTHIKQQLKIRYQMINNQELQLFQKLQQIIMNCLKIDKQQRPTIFELCQQLKIDYL